MIDYNLVLTIICFVILFLFSIERFSKDMQKLSGEKFKKFMKRSTSNPVKGTFVGTIVTAVIQSSTATTVIAVGLVNAGVITFYNSLGIILGANLGTTITAQLVAFKLTAIAPIFVILGFLISLKGEKYKLLGRAIFYFGLVFFSLNLVATYVEPIAENPAVIELFSKVSNLFLAILAGFIFTIVIQASAITIGLAVILVSTNLLNFNQAVGIMLGANLGTTITALVASIRMDLNAKRTAMAHFVLNLIGIIIILPFFIPFVNLIYTLGGTDSIKAANFNLIYNVFLVLFGLILVKPFYKLIMYILPAKD